MIETSRLVLRSWRDGDAAAHNALASHPRVAEILGQVPTLTDVPDGDFDYRELAESHPLRRHVPYRIGRPA